MAAADTTLDFRSLTLPSLTRVKAKFKKPRKPSFTEVLYLFNVIWDIVWSVLDFLTGKIGSSICAALLAACWWKAYQLCRNGVDGRPDPDKILKVIIWVFGILVISIFIPD